ncbi:alpha/beta hydrolase [Mycobacterium nebraskense]|uniref:Alpha/beta hydrolase n=2 Tax=Mycobacterium nebraskense TaxID=244292 RepID=A0A1X1Z1U4_9MYCO|nr:alpha/beta fold hydrolase [Mycobacterium nebraskense]KLO47073.1 alpha/beta hydrolase [Mycobacterium nebraskense]MBI2693840.1 alpha/beta fold hydrolase [Mycobacterium nebraskense]MCV7119397.1 alpha/beta fold hydrolase [Mycobacterium nebraskense]ORW17280.1 alpha/beta hydrolase [Mycobacterium nebraskense]
MLEVIDKGSCTRDHPVPLLFVHGGWHGAWCWEHFLDFFADAGYRAAAVSLRGHGASPTAKPLHKVSIADYIDDVRSVSDKLGGPVLIGHSLGGFVIQRHLEDRTAPAAVLVGSVPPQGVLTLAMRVWRRRPSMTMEAWSDRSLLKFLATPALAREYLFCADTPEAIVESCRQRAGAESVRAAMTDPMVRRVRTRRVTTPILVLGARYDGFVSVGEVRATARAYRTEPEFFSMGHNMMLEPGWADVAERIHAWLVARDLVSRAR